LALLHFYVRLPVAVGENENVPICAAGCVGFFSRRLLCLSSRGLVAYNGLRLKKVGDFEAQTLF
jgi:hypothetical protein